MDNSNYSKTQYYQYVPVGEEISTCVTNFTFVTAEEFDFLQKCKELGMIGSNIRKSNQGKSDYSKHLIQPWSIIQEYKLDYWDGDIIKRVLRTKEGESRELDYQKIIHICEEKLRQLEYGKIRNNN